MNRPINQILCTNLVRLRIKHRYSQREISEVLKVTQPSYNRMESGSTSISGERIYQLAKFYKVPIHDLFCEKGFDYRNESSTKEVDILQEKLLDTKLVNKILKERNDELQEKLRRKDRKIDILLKQTYPAY